MPEGAVYVGGPGIWGNPFIVGSYYMRGDAFSKRGPLSMVYTAADASFADERFTLIASRQEEVEWFRWYRTKRSSRDLLFLRGKGSINRATLTFCWSWRTHEYVGLRVVRKHF